MRKRISEEERDLRQRERMKKWRAANKERISAYNKKYGTENKEHLRTYQRERLRARRASDPEKTLQIDRQRHKKWRDANKEHVKKTSRQAMQRLRERKPLYDTWRGMWERCTNPNAARYKRYGGRGIRVCKRWESYENFVKDMGPKPSPQHSVDRKNNNGNYCKSNCRWATTIQQARNK
jgi:hypothetical protein